jgi:hypothetical protein
MDLILMNCFRKKDFNRTENTQASRRLPAISASDSQSRGLGSAPGPVRHTDAPMGTKESR